jgi:hypothetical protein
MPPSSRSSNSVDLEQRCRERADTWTRPCALTNGGASSLGPRLTIIGFSDMLSASSYAAGAADAQSSPISQMLAQIITVVSGSESLLHSFSPGGGAQRGAPRDQH